MLTLPQPPEARASLPDEPLRWVAYLRPRDCCPGLLRLFHVFNLGSLLSLTLPFKLGFPARALLLTKTLKLSAAVAAGVLVLDGLIYAILSKTPRGYKPPVSSFEIGEPPD